MLVFSEMALISKTFNSVAEVAEHLKNGAATFYHTSRTSTVVPFETLERALGADLKDITIGDLSVIAGELSFDDEQNLIVRGAVTWKDAKEFCLSKGREIKTSPTEELAGVLSGLATSCTGERCFSFGTLREQVIQCKYLDFEGQERTLFRDKKLSESENVKTDFNLLQNYQKTYEPYKSYKNAPFPRMQVETDLMIGTEGQLGVITEATLETTKKSELLFLFLMLPKWEEDYTHHLQIFAAVQKLRDKIFACELIDENSQAFLDKADRPAVGKDLIFLEIEASSFEAIYESFFSKLDLPEEDIFQITAEKCRQLRMNIPRAIFEANTKAGVTKKGTDVQVTPDKFAKLLDYYREFSREKVSYNLFGHFGDAHLHFNFMPNSSEVEHCQKLLEGLYDAILEWKGSPFAEHGVGIIKKTFIKKFYEDIHFELFSSLKKEMDPKNIMFPQGFMSMDKNG